MASIVDRTPIYRPLIAHENPGRIAQRESVPFTRERSKVRSLVRPPRLKGFGALLGFSHSSVSHKGQLYVGLARVHFVAISRPIDRRIAGQFGVTKSEVHSPDPG